MTIFEEFEAKARQKENEEMTKNIVKNLVHNTKLSLKDIAQTLNISIKKVKEIQALL